MRTKEFLSKLEHDRIVRAIREAESNTSGEIRVFVQRGKLSVAPLIVAPEKISAAWDAQDPRAQRSPDFHSAASAQIRRCWRQSGPRKMRRAILAGRC